MPGGSDLDKDFDKGITALEALLLDQQAADPAKGPLYASWHFMQRYSV